MVGKIGLFIKRQTALFVIAIVGVAIVVLSYLAWEKHLLRIENDLFQNTASDITELVRSSIDSNVAVLSDLQAFFDASEKVTPDEFQHFSSVTLESHAAISSSAWLPDFQSITDKKVPIAFVYPGSTKDTLQQILKRISSLKQALSSSASSAKPLMLLASASSSTQQRIVLFNPVYQFVASQGHTGKLRGFIVLLLDSNSVLSEAIGVSKKEAIPFEVSAAVNPREVEAIYKSGDFRISPQYKADSQLSVLNQVWHIHFEAQRLAFLPQLAWVGSFIVLLGLLLVILVSTFTRNLLQRNRRIQREVAERTQDYAIANDALIASESGMRLILETAAEGVYGLDREGRGTFVNPAALKMLGYRKEELLGQFMHHIIHHSYADGSVYPSEKCPMRLAFEQGKGSHVEEEVLWRKDGSPMPVRYSVKPMRQNGELMGAVVTFSDITGELETKERLSHLSHYDSLTELPNRSFFDETLRAVLKKSNEENQKVAFFYLDLDHFKDVNDSLGHKTGDLLLVAFVERIASQLKSKDFLARLGGDEFVILRSDILSVESEMQFAQKLIRLIEKPFVLGEHKVNVSLSVGVAIYPESSKRPTDLLQAADIALYRAKGQGGGQAVFYSQEIAEGYRARLRMSRDLHVAIERNELFLVYQPQFDLQTQKIIGVEVLLRWQHQELGLISPAVFIDVAEEIGEIARIGQWVIEQSCEQYARWLKEGITLERFAFNVSPKQLIDSSFAKQLQQTVLDSGLRCEQIEVELTETEIMVSDQLEAPLAQLNQMGFKIYIDDFGTGYSSLARLKKLPVSGLKIDRSFIQDIPGDSNDEAVVQTIIALSKSLGLGLVAEGVETAEQAAFLLANGCRDGQGFWVSKPLSASDFERLYFKHHKA